MQPGNMFPEQSTQEKVYQARLETYTADPHIKVLVDAPDLITLLCQLEDSDIQTLPTYLHLTQMTSQKA